MNTPTVQAHIITHTHWDREWFLTSIYTSQWIAGLITKIEELAAVNPRFQYLLDGQTLVIEDLLKTAPAYRERVQNLIRQGNLLIGPYYCQPDWQMTTGEALIRNLQYGQQDVESLGGSQSDTGWLVDTFGHIGQAPQIHRMFGVDSVFVWRGVPQLVPYFKWTGADGQDLFAIDLFGGYRNLYGITHAPEIAVQRLTAEVQKLAPYYPSADIPLFDGYDLEDSPEDPGEFYTRHGATLPDHITFQASTPHTFVETVRQRLDTLPEIVGELNSGKYGATFPGTFSARAYLKVMAHDCTSLLYNMCEPLAALAHLKGRPYPAERFEDWSRLLLQNAVHDCICGVSIDQVHEKMEYHYRQVFDGAHAELEDALAVIMQGFAPGTYAVSTTPLAHEGWVFSGDTAYRVKTDGVGVWRVQETCRVEAPESTVDAFQWTNDHYAAQVNADGTVQLGVATLGRLVVSAEHGDTYSDERGVVLGVCQMADMPVIEQQSDIHSVVRFTCTFDADGVAVLATVRLQFDDSPLIRWTIDLDSYGTDFQVNLVFDTQQQGTVFAGMPFDVTKRPAADRDLLPRDLDPTLAKILLGQRELGEVRTFPFHDMVGIEGAPEVAMILAKGIYGYQAQDDGQIAVTLRRSVEWLTRAALENRVGDAGPFFYVPDARSERLVRHEFAVAMGRFDALDQQRLNAAFQNPPIIAAAQTAGEQIEWQVFREDLPLSSLQVVKGRIIARVWNPSDQPVALRAPLQSSDVWGNVGGLIEQIRPHAVETVALAQDQDQTAPLSGEVRPVEMLAHGLPWRVGENHGHPSREALGRLNALIQDLATRVADLETRLAELPSGPERYRTEHQLYARKRELYEYRLSVRLNELKLATGGELTEAYLFEPDAQVAAIGFELNRLRIKRRIYDYIVECI